MHVKNHESFVLKFTLELFSFAGKNETYIQKEIKSKKKEKIDQIACQKHFTVQSFNHT